MLMLANVLGVIAGSILLLSGLPVLCEQLRNARAGSSGERRSRLMMAAGNGLWVLAGAASGFWAVCVMCGIQAAIQLEIYRRMRTGQASQS
ncbi:MAG: hypothetical protein NXH97_23620 [Rhodobacteraceae bacterium]|nr:hypothetical protein [Paracoccaceae bacterium]